MDGEGLKELFEPFGPIAVKRMFSGHGLFADGLFFALEIGGEIYLKTHAPSEPSFRAAGSTPFAYQGRGRRITTSLWRLPAEAYDDPDELKRWCGLALEAARAKSAKAMRAKAPAKSGRKNDRPKRKATVGAAKIRVR